VIRPGPRFEKNHLIGFFERDAKSCGIAET